MMHRVALESVPVDPAPALRVPGARGTATRFTFTAGVLLITALFLAGTLGRAQQKLLWHDEIITAILAGLPPGEMWAALHEGVDFNPPGFHLLLHANHSMFGEGLIRTRLPAAVGVLVAALCAGIFVRRRLGVSAGLSAILLFLCTPAYFYAYEARPYGAVLACAGLALVCWQSAATVTPRRLWLAGLWASLAGALAFHYYAVLLYVPFAAGEAVRLLTRRRADWPLWITVAASTAPLLLWMPLISSLRGFSSGYFVSSGHSAMSYVGPGLRTILESYESTLTEVAMPLLIVLVLAGSVHVFARRQPVQDPAPTSPVAEEWVLISVLVLLPGVAFLLASGWTGALVQRYYLSWTIGLAILVPVATAHLIPRWRQVTAILAVVFFLWFAARQVAAARHLASEPLTFASAYPLLEQSNAADEALPIVIDHLHVYLSAVYYSPPALQSRLVNLTPPSGVKPISAGGLHALDVLARWEPIRLEPFDRFVVRHKRFLVYGPSSAPVLEWLRNVDAVLVLRGVDDDVQRFATSRPGPNLLYEATLTAQ